MDISFLHGAFQNASANFRMEIKKATRFGSLFKCGKGESNPHTRKGVRP